MCISWAGHQGDPTDASIAAAVETTAQADERSLAMWRRSAVELLGEATEDTAFVDRARELLPVHVRDIQVVLDAPQFRRNTAER